MGTSNESPSTSSPPAEVASTAWLTTLLPELERPLKLVTVGALARLCIAMAVTMKEGRNADEAAPFIALATAVQLIGLALAFQSALRIMAQRDVPTAIRVVLLGAAMVFLLFLAR